MSSPDITQITVSFGVIIITLTCIKIIVRLTTKHFYSYFRYIVKKELLVCSLIHETKKGYQFSYFLKIRLASEIANENVNFEYNFVFF